MLSMSIEILLCDSSMTLESHFDASPHSTDTDCIEFSFVPRSVPDLQESRFCCISNDMGDGNGREINNH